MKRVYSAALILLVLMTGLMPVGVAADSAIFYDVDNDVTYSIELHSKTAEIGGEVSYTATIRNNSKYNVNIEYIVDSFDNYFESEDDNGYALSPGKTMRMDITGTIPEESNWYMRDGKAYMDVKLDLAFQTDREPLKEEGAWAELINQHPETVEITNIKDGSGLIDLKIYGDDAERAFLDCGYNLNWHLNSSKTNIYGYTILPISITNISNQNLDEVLVYPCLFGDRVQQIALSPNDGAFFMVNNYMTIEPNQSRPETSEAIAKVLIKKDGEYYGVQETTVCRNIFIDQEPESEIAVKRLPEAQQTTEAGMDSYSITFKNVSRHPIQNLYIDLLGPGYYWSTEGSFENTDTIYLFEINDEVTRNFTAPDQGKFEVHIGSVVFGEKIPSISYLYDVDTQTGEVGNGYPYMYFEYDSEYERAAHYIVDQIGGDLPTRLTALLEKTNAEPTAMPTPTVLVENEVTPEPVPTPTAQVVYITEKPAIPSWVWPLLGLAIVLAGGLVLGLRQKQSKE